MAVLFLFGVATPSSAAAPVSADEAVTRAAQVMSAAVAPVDPQKVHGRWFDPRLRQRGKWLRPRAVVTDASIARRYGQGFGFWFDRRYIRLVPDGVGSPRAAVFVKQVVVSPNVLADTDAFVRVGLQGVETMLQLRSPEAPERFRFRVRAGKRVQLLKSHGSVAAVVGRRVILVVTAPWALDAAGHSVPGTLSVDGNSIVWSLRHRGLGLAYPLISHTAALAPAKKTPLLPVPTSVGTNQDRQQLRAACGLVCFAVAGALAHIISHIIAEQMLHTHAEAAAPTPTLPPVLPAAPQETRPVSGGGGGGYWRPPSRVSYRPPRRPRPPPPPLVASLDDQFGMDGTGALYSFAGGPATAVGWNVRFNRTFDTNRYVLRPDTAASIAQFAADKGDLRADPAPNDNRVGYFRTSIQVPRGTPPGSYLLRWTVVDTVTGRSAGLQPSLLLVVSPAQFAGPYDEVVVPTGGTRLVKVFVRNRSDRIWQRGTDNLHFVDPQGHDLIYPYCGSTPDWLNGNAAVMAEKTVAPGYVATFLVRVCGQAGYQGTATLRLQYVHEGVAHASEVFPLHLRFTPDQGAPESYPLRVPEDGEPAGFQRPTEEVFIPTGGSALVPVWVRNQTARTWRRDRDHLHFVDPLGHDLTYPYCGSTPEWLNGNAVQMVDESAPPGEVALFLVRVCGQAGYQGTATLRLQYVEESVDHYPPIFPLRLRFGPPPPATFVGPDDEGRGQELAVPTGGSRLIEVAVRNDSGRTWVRGQDNLHFVDESGSDLIYPYCGLVPEWTNGNAVLMAEERVAAGQVAHFRVKVCGAPGYEGPATLRLQYIQEAVAHYPPISALRLRFAP